MVTIIKRKCSVSAMFLDTVIVNIGPVNVSSYCFASAYKGHEDAKKHVALERLNTESLLNWCIYLHWWYGSGGHYLLLICFPCIHWGQPWIYSSTIHWL